MAGEFAYVGKSVTDLSTVTQADAGAVATGDWVIFGEGNQSIQTNLNTWAALSGGAGADGLERVQVKRPFTGNIGGTGGSLQVDVSYNTTSVFLYDAGGGNLYYSPGTTASLCDRFKNTGFGKLYLTGGTITNYEGFRGYANISSSAIVTNGYVSGGTFDADYNATGLTVGIFSNCTANIQRPVTTMTVLAGAIVNVFRVDSSATKPTATTINLYGGTLNWRGGAITTLNAWSPVDFSNLTSAVTVGTLNITANALAKSNLNQARASGQPGATFTTVVVYGAYEDNTGTVLP